MPFGSRRSGAPVWPARLRQAPAWAAVPIEIVYVGHRDGTTMMVHEDSSIHLIRDLSGTGIAVPTAPRISR